MKGYLHKISTMRSGRDDKMDKQEKGKFRKSGRLMDITRKLVLKGKSQQEREMKNQGKSHKLMNKKLNSVGHVIMQHPDLSMAGGPSESALGKPL